MKELLEFLIEKCQNGLKEAEEKCATTQLKDELKEIENVLNSRKSPPPHIHHLYDLISILTDITMSNKHPAQILCVPLQIRSRRQARKNLRVIRAHLENPGVSEVTADKSLNGKKEEGGPSETVSWRRICKILPCLKRSLGQGTKKNSPNQSVARPESAGKGTQENGGKEVSSELQGLPKIEAKNIQGFDAMIKKIESRLDFKKRRGHVEIGILGMCGSGKTTLAQRIYSQSSVAKDFEPRIWVSLPHIPVSKQRDDKKILTFILEQCGDGVDQSAMAGYGRPQLLRTVRKNLLGKRYLLVLDGLWEADIEWYFELSRALDWQYKYRDFGDDGSQSAVILTSRLDDVAKTMVGISGLHQIHPLLDQECWDIFMDQSQSSNIKWENEKELKEEIKEQCDGLPLAALTLAKIIPTLLSNPPPPSPPPPPPPQVAEEEAQA